MSASLEGLRGPAGLGELPTTEPPGLRLPQHRGCFTQARETGPGRS